MTQPQKKSLSVKLNEYVPLSRSRRLLLVALVGLLFVGLAGRQIWVMAQQPGPPNVYLGGATFVPGSLTGTGTSDLIVSVATTPAVPSIGTNGTSPIRAVVEISEAGNLSDISYSAPQAYVQSVDLVGRGWSSNASFTFRINSQNIKAGAISYRTNLVRLENAPTEVTTAEPMTADATLTVTTSTPSHAPKD